MNKQYLIVISAIISIIAVSAVLGISGPDVLTSNDTINDNSVADEYDHMILNASNQNHNYTAIPREIAQSNNEFAVKFYQQISTDENIFFSPTGMYTAFSLLYEGARENTAKQIEQVFGFEPDAFLRHNSTAHMISALNQDDPYATLQVANALWIANIFSPYPEYLDIADKTYIATAEILDFKSDAEGSAETINQWASEKTNDKITKVVTHKDLKPGTAMVINNAIYFKGTWLSQFSMEDTKELDFRQNSTSSVKADFMNQHSSFNYTHSDGAQVLKLPYEGDRLSMLVILPESLDVQHFEENVLSAQQIQKWNKSMSSTSIVVLMPKFEMKTNYLLNDHLKSLGMPDVFEALSSDLTGIGPSHYPLYVTKATQDAYVKVNESGTEAAAVTTAIIVRDSGPSQFVANHPFLFLIQDDDSGAILFMGKLYDPSS